MSVLQLQDITKRFPGVLALDDVSLDIQAGEVHAIVGENGAGKSTLGKIAAGLYQPDSGLVELDGQPVRFAGPSDAVQRGISMVHQELLFCENLTVAENLSLDAFPTRGPFIDREAMRERAIGWLQTIGSDVSPDARLGSLSVSRQQLVQIAGGIGRGARVLIFDEPTSSLSKPEADKLLDLIRQLREGGTACVYVSHRMDEIFAVADRITVLRDGRLVDTVRASDIDRTKLVGMMIGRELSFDNTTREPADDAPTVLKVENLSTPRGVESVSFSLKAGEIVGLAGLVGAGRTEIVEALFGLDYRATGDVWLSDVRLQLRPPSETLESGIGLTPEDRKRHGLVLGMSCRHNITLPILDRLSFHGWMHDRAERALVTDYFNKLGVRAAGIDVEARGLSGGNQQKLVLARWLAADCQVLLVDEPTRGVDVGAKAEIYELLREFAAQGKALLVVSSELPELLALATRILVVREGRLVADVLAQQSTEDSLMRAMAGVVPTG